MFLPFLIAFLMRDFFSSGVSAFHVLRIRLVASLRFGPLFGSSEEDSSLTIVLFPFFAFSGKATAFFGPFFLGYFTQLFNSQRYGIAVVLCLLVIGTILMQSVDEEAGMAASHSPEVT